VTVDVFAAVFASLVVNAHFVVPVGVHEAFVAVAKRGVAQGQRAGAGWLEDTGALVQNGWAVVIVVIIAAVIPVSGGMNGRVSGRVDGRVRGWMNGRVRGGMNGRVRGGMDGRVRGEMVIVSGGVDGRVRGGMVIVNGGVASSLSIEILVVIFFGDVAFAVLVGDVALAVLVGDLNELVHLSIFEHDSVGGSKESNSGKGKFHYSSKSLVFYFLISPRSHLLLYGIWLLKIGSVVIPRYTTFHL